MQKSFSIDLSTEYFLSWKAILYLAEEKRPKVKKPKSEFPEYTAPNSGGITYVPLHEEASTIEEIEEQMADWLDSRPRGQKKVSRKKQMH